MNRAHRRRFGKLSDNTEAAIQGDRLFFTRHSDRSFRLRLAARGEVAENAEIGAASICEPGFRWFVAVRQAAVGLRFRLFFRDLETRETDVSEAAARAAFEWLETDHTRRLGAMALHHWNTRNEG